MLCKFQAQVMFEPHHNSCLFNTITATDKNFNVGSNNASSFHRSSSLPAFNSAVNNGPLGSKGLRGDGGFKSNALGTTTNDSFVSGMGQLSISTNKVPIKQSTTTQFSIMKNIIHPGLCMMGLLYC